MAVNPNFTNANATTPYASGSGGYGANVFVSSINFVGPGGGELTSYAPVEGMPGGVVSGTTSGTAPITALELWFGENQIGTGQYSKSRWTPTGLTTQGKATGTQYSNVIRFNSQTDGSVNDTLSFSRVSTIQVSGGSADGSQINMVALASTLKTLYPSIILG